MCIRDSVGGVGRLGAEAGGLGVLGDVHTGAVIVAVETDDHGDHAPVSYTHLDVYKRQLVYHAAKRERTALFLLVGYLAQVLPWVFISRLTFEYHYFCLLYTSHPRAGCQTRAKNKA